MSRRRPLHRYPAEYYQLFAAAQTRDVTVPCATPSKAQSFRADLYNLRKQVREALSTDPTLTDLAEHLLLMENIIIRQRSDTLILTRKVNHNATIASTAISRSRELESSGDL